MDERVQMVMKCKACPKYLEDNANHSKKECTTKMYCGQCTGRDGGNHHSMLHGSNHKICNSLVRGNYTTVHPPKKMCSPIVQNDKFSDMSATIISLSATIIN